MPHIEGQLFRVPIPIVARIPSDRLAGPRHNVRSECPCNTIGWNRCAAIRYGKYNRNAIGNIASDVVGNVHQLCAWPLGRHKVGDRKDVSQFQVIEETGLVSITGPVVFVVPKTGIDPVPVQLVARQLTPDAITAETEQVTVEPQI